MNESALTAADFIASSLNNAVSSSALEKSPAWPALSTLTLRVHVQIPMPRMKVRDVVALRTGMLLSSEVPETNDVAFGIAGTQLAWCEFSVVDDRIGIRLTRSA